ncbi:MAG: FaeA/PapI family transcriptional regulator [Serratia marcescens]|nr:hypothetical protein [Serratia marcescens]EJC6395442.1 hypothetical protein [Serratia marcescens]MDU7466739.1 FaeA/PapI family transcriptional regulator [Serratia marcescens]HEJ7007228.1 hypothetical protein [Serratia marcescens]
MTTDTEKLSDGLSPTERLIEAATQQCITQQGRNPNVQESWPSTRDIAENCNFSIYKTRYFLLKMAAKGWVQVTPRPVKNALRWYTCKDLSSDVFPNK